MGGNSPSNIDLRPDDTQQLSPFATTNSLKLRADALAPPARDTMPVLQAVLDTQFWLATHVITVTLGYAASFLAGGLGIVTAGPSRFLQASTSRSTQISPSVK